MNLAEIRTGLPMWSCMWVAALRQLHADSLYYFARKFGMKSLYPFDTWKLNKEEYKKYSQIMKPYLRPRINGVNKLYLYTDGFREYLKDKQKDGGVCVSGGNERIFRGAYGDGGKSSLSDSRSERRYRSRI